jgi:hypothetical protein
MKVTFRKQYRDGHYTVFADGKEVGYTRSEKYGWKQFDAKRGAPSQHWDFISEAAPFKTVFGVSYFKDLKSIVLQQVTA